MPKQYYKVFYNLAIPGYGEIMKGEKLKYVLSKEEIVYTSSKGVFEGIVQKNIANMTLINTKDYNNGLSLRFGPAMMN